MSFDRPIAESGGEPERTDLSAVAATRQPTSDPTDIRSLALKGLFALALFHTLYVAKLLILPILLAVLANFALTPVVRGLRRFYVPTALGSAIVVLALVGASALTVSGLAEPASGWAERLPESLRRIERKIRFIKAPLQNLSEAGERMEQITDLEGAGGRPQAARRAPFSLVDSLLNQTQAFASLVMSALVLLYFLLASGDSLLNKIADSMTKIADKRAAVDVIRRTESEISRYLLTIAVINLSLGLATTVLMYFLAMPSPVLWGVLAAVLNFVPFIGGAVTALILAGVALLTFEQAATAFAVPVIFGLLTALEGFFVTPTVLGRSLSLSPVAVFASLLIWAWLWGIPGALIAVPTLAAIKIVCDQVESLKVVGTVLGR